jgi:hypothetical protein
VELSRRVRTARPGQTQDAEVGPVLPADAYLEGTQRGSLHPFRRQAASELDVELARVGALRGSNVVEMIARLRQALRTARGHQEKRGNGSPASGWHLPRLEHIS